MKKKALSQFEAWFVMQFGKNPYLPSRELRRKVEQARSHLECVEGSYNEALTYERRRDAALKAWCARDKA